uniref:Uncharacterized protein n=1 Tax=Arion vulgaris TaxID=1028688 RepID=A0A0B7AMD6_9EUPU
MESSSDGLNLHPHTRSTWPHKHNVLVKWRMHSISNLNTVNTARGNTHIYTRERAREIEKYDDETTVCYSNFWVIYR